MYIMASLKRIVFSWRDGQFALCKHANAIIAANQSQNHWHFTADILLRLAKSKSLTWKHYWKSIKIWIDRETTQLLLLLLKLRTMQSVHCVQTNPSMFLKMKRHIKCSRSYLISGDGQFANLWWQMLKQIMNNSQTH